MLKDILKDFDEKFEDYYIVKAEIRDFLIKSIQSFYEEIKPEREHPKEQDETWNDAVDQLEENKSKFFEKI